MTILLHNHILWQGYLLVPMISPSRIVNVIYKQSLYCVLLSLSKIKWFIIIKTISKSNVQGLTVSTEICPLRVPYIMLFKPLTLCFFHGPLTTTQWPKEKVQKDKQRCTKHTYKTKDRVTRVSVLLR
jgi:hypothetical protein